MKVVHVVECFSAGTAHFINLLTQHTTCEHIVIHGERVDEISAEAMKARFPKEVRFIPWKNAQREIKPLQDFKALMELMQILKNLKGADVIHLHSSKAGFIGRVASFLARIHPVIYTPNGAPFARADVSSKKQGLYIWLEKLANKLSGQVVCCSPSEAQSYAAIGIAAPFINNGTPLPVRQPDRNNTQIGSSDDVFTIVTCGRITEQKNPALFNQIAAFFSQSKQVNFIWIGDGDAEQRAHLTAQNIRVTGWMPKSEVESVISNSHLYLSTSLWEGLPFSVLEALSLGKCLLLSKCVGNVDLVKDGYNGYSFLSAKDAIARIQELMKNRAAIHQMEQNSREWSEREFDIRIVSKQYQDLYAALSETGMNHSISNR